MSVAFVKRTISSRARASRHYCECAPAISTTIEDREYCRTVIACSRTEAPEMLT